MDTPVTLAYPRWVAAGGVVVAVVAAGFAVVVWTAGTSRWIAVFAALVALVGVSFVATARTNRFRLDTDALERLDGGVAAREPRRVRWSDVCSVGAVGAGQGLRIADDDRSIDVPGFVRNFDVLCDMLLRLLPSDATLDGDAARLLVERSTLPAPELERAYARCFAMERDDPPPGLDDDAIAAAAANSFAFRMLGHHGDVEPFEARWDPKAGAVRIVHDVDADAPLKRRRARASVDHVGDAPAALVVRTASATTRTPI